jgi:hypothetical protein
MIGRLFVVCLRMTDDCLVHATAHCRRCLLGGTSQYEILNVSSHNEASKVGWA